MLELLADEAPLEYPEGAFLSGLFHDVGTLLIAVAMPQQYECTLAVAAVNGQPAVECERMVLGTDHAELSALALERWGLANPFATPPPIITIRNPLRRRSKPRMAFP